VEIGHIRMGSARNGELESEYPHSILSHDNALIYPVKIVSTDGPHPPFNPSKVFTLDSKGKLL
jgi:hypothetical protein